MSHSVDPRRALDRWFRVAFDESGVTVDVAPPGGPGLTQSFAWASVIRVCLKLEAFGEDGIYIFTSERPQSYVIPVQATGGGPFFDELLRRGLFAADLAIEAASATEGIFCWPADDVSPQSKPTGATPCAPPEPAGTTDFDAAELAAHLRRKLPDRGHLSAERIAELRGEMAAGGLRTLAELDAILDSTRTAVAAFEADQGRKGIGALSDVGVARVALRIFDIRFLRAAEWHFSTEEGLAANDAAQYAAYRRLVERS